MRIGVAAARELALFVPLKWGDSDRDVLAPLVDAMLVRADDDTLARIAEPIVASLWQDGLRAGLEVALEAAAARHGRLAQTVDLAYADLAARQSNSRFALAVVEQAAIEFADDEQGFDCCLLCVHDRLLTAPVEDRAGLARTVARIAARAAAIPADDVRRAVTAAAFTGGDVALALATDERRVAVRRWLGRLAELGAESIRPLAVELRALADESLPAAADDEIWRETVAGLSARLAPVWN